MDNNYVTIGLFIIGGLCGIIAYFQKSLFDRFEKSNDKIEAIVTDWGLIKKDIGNLMHDLDKLSKAAESIVILKRDQQSIWRNVDDLKNRCTKLEEISEVVRERTHFLANKLTVIRGKMEEEGSEFAEDWEFPTLKK